MEKNISQVKSTVKPTLILYFLYFLFSTLSAYMLGNKDVGEYSYILGFPSWFFFSCILAYPLCCIGVYFLVEKFFSHNDIL